MIYQKDWFMVSNRWICKDIKVDQPDQMCRKSTLRSFHKILWFQTPYQIFNLIKFNSRHRDFSKLNLKLQPSKQTSKKTVLENALELFNNLPAGMKFMSPKKAENSFNQDVNIIIQALPPNYSEPQAILKINHSHQDSSEPPGNI